MLKNLLIRDADLHRASINNLDNRIARHKGPYAPDYLIRQREFHVTQLARAERALESRYGTTTEEFYV